MTHALQSFAEHSHLFLDIIFIWVDVKMLTDAYLCLLMLSVIFISRSLSIFILSTKHFYAYKND